MSAEHAHLIVWQPPGSHFASSDRQYVGLMQTFLRALGGSRYYQLIEEYASAPGFGPVIEGPVTDVAGLSGTYVDRARLPRPATDRHPLPMSAVRHEIMRVMGLNGWPASLHDLYIILVPSGVRTCVEFQGRCASFGRDQNHPLLACATHQYFIPEDQPVLFLYLPVVADQPHCRPDSRHSFGGFGDRVSAAELDALARGVFDTVTDPVGTGWYAGTPQYEVGEVCHGVRAVRLKSRVLPLPAIWGRQRGTCVTPTGP